MTIIRTLKKLFFILMILCPFVLFFNLSAAKKKVIAVLEPVVADISKEFSYLSNQLVSSIEHRLSKEKALSITERRALKKVLREHKLSLLGVTEGDVKVGRLLRADYLISGKYYLKSNKIYITLTLINVDSGKIVISQQIEGDANLDIFKRVEAAVGLLAAEALGQRTVPLDVRSDPADAEVYVDGNFAGKTPLLNYFLPPRKVQLAVKKEYYREQKNEYDLEKEKELKLQFDLLKYLNQVHPNKLELGFIKGLVSSQKNLVLFSGFKAAYGYSYHDFEIGGGFNYSTARRKHNLNVFGDKVPENRDISTTYFNARALYFLNLSDAWIYLFGGFCTGITIMNEELSIPDEEGYEEEIGLTKKTGREYFQKYYQVNTVLPTISPILGFEFFPNYFIAVRLMYQYDFRTTYYSKNGKFNPLGQKTFKTVEINPSYGHLSIGIRFAF
jgi:TolB-like protein